MSCYCDNWDYTPKCPGFETEITIWECGKELEHGEEICDGCVEARKRQEQIEDDAVEDYYRRQLEMEEYQLMEAFGDFDEDGDREEEDGKKHP